MRLIILAVVIIRGSGIIFLVDGSHIEDFTWAVTSRDEESFDLTKIKQQCTDPKTFWQVRNKGTGHTSLF